MLRQNWYNSLSNKVEYKSVKKFIISCSSLVLVFGILYLFGNIDKIPFAFAFVCTAMYLAGVLILPVLYGFYSYAITKRIILPNLILFLVYDVFWGGFLSYIICVLENKKYSVDMLLDALPMGGIVIGLSLLTSLVAMWDYKSMKRKMNSKENSEDNPDNIED